VFLVSSMFSVFLQFVLCDVLCMSNACFCFLCLQFVIYVCVELKVGWKMEWKGFKDLRKTYNYQT